MKPTRKRAASAILPQSSLFRDTNAHAATTTPWALFLSAALLLALSFFARHIAGYVFTHGNYNPLVYNPATIRQMPPAKKYSFQPDDQLWDETRAYARWTQEVRRGELVGAAASTYAPFFSQASSVRTNWVRDRLGPVLLAGLSYLSGGVPEAFAWADLVFPFAAVLAVLWLSWLIRSSIPFALSAGTLVCVFTWADLRKFEQALRGSDDLTSTLSRTPYPQLSLALFALFLVILLKTVERPRKYVLWLAFVFALNCYTYFYSWVYACCWIAIVSLQSVFEYFGAAPAAKAALFRRFGYLLLACFITAFLAFPVWRNVVSQSQAAFDSFFRLNGSLTHRPNVTYTFILSVGLLIVLRLKPSRGRQFSVSFLAASLLVLNQQVITGKTIQAGHWTAYFIQPLIWIVLLDCLWIAAELLPSRGLMNSAWTLLLLAALFNATKLTIEARNEVEYNKLNREFSALIRTLNSPEYRNCAFVTNDAYLAVILPGYTTVKSLEPWYMDPLSNHDLARLRYAIRQEYPWSFVSGDGASSPSDVPLQVRPEKVILVLNRHREVSNTSVEGRQPVLEGTDFQLFAPASPCPAN